MRTLFLALAFAAALCAQTTTLTDTLRDTRGRLVSGIILLEWPQYVDASGVTVGAGRGFVPVVKGRVSVSLVPTDTGTPSGRTYSAVYAILGGYSRRAEDWHICTTGSTLTIADAVNASCPSGGGGGVTPAVISWASLTSVQWASLTSADWAALVQ